MLLYSDTWQITELLTEKDHHEWETGDTEINIKLKHLWQKQEFLNKLRNISVLIDKVKDYIQTQELLTQLVLDASTVLNPAEILDILELQSRGYVYKIHQPRITKLKRISQFNYSLTETVNITSII